MEFQPDAELVRRISSYTKRIHKNIHYICVSHCFPTRIHHLSGFLDGKTLWDSHLNYKIQIEMLQSIKSTTDGLNIIIEHVQKWDTMSSSKSLNDGFFDWGNHDHFLISDSPQSLRGSEHKLKVKGWIQCYNIAIITSWLFMTHIRPRFEMSRSWNETPNPPHLCLTPPNDFCNQLQAIETNFYNAIPVALIAFTIGSILPTPVQGDQGKIKDHHPDSLKSSLKLR